MNKSLNLRFFGAVECRAFLLTIGGRSNLTLRRQNKVAQPLFGDLILMVLVGKRELFIGAGKKDPILNDDACLDLLLLILAK